MDADTQTALDTAADDAMREYQTQESCDRALTMRKVLTDGVCRIREVLDTAVYPCVGYIWTEFGEKFPVFNIGVREAAKANIAARVKLDIQMSARGTRYVTGMARLPVDASTSGWPCLKCWQVLARPSADGRFYQCPRCAYQMEVGP